MYSFGNYFSFIYNLILLSSFHQFTTSQTPVWETVS